MGLGEGSLKETDSSFEGVSLLSCSLSFICPCCLEATVKAGASTAILHHGVICKMGATSDSEWSRRKEPGSLGDSADLSYWTALGLLFCKMIISYVLKPLLF